MTRKSVKNAIMKAAFELVESGKPITIDAVIARAGVSKGGFFYYFKSKEMLLTALVDSCIRAVEEDAISLSFGVPSEATSPSILESYIRLSFSGEGVGSRTSVVIIALATQYPELLDPLREFFRKRAAAIEATATNPSVALAAILLADGLWIFDALGVAPASAEQRSKMLQSVLEWIRQSYRQDDKPDTAPNGRKIGKPEKTPRDSD